MSRAPWQDKDNSSDATFINQQLRLFLSNGGGLFCGYFL